MFKVILLSLTTVVLIGACVENNTGSQTANTAESQCMEKYRWDTKAVNTSRFAVQLHYEQMGKGQLAKHISDREAVRMVYCSK